MGVLVGVLRGCVDWVGCTILEDRGWRPVEERRE